MPFRANTRERFTPGEHEVSGVCTVGDGIEGGASFAFGGFGAGGFQRVEARGLFAFVVCSHVGYRIADELEDARVKCFRILAKWLLISPCRLAAQPGYEKGLELEYDLTSQECYEGRTTIGAFKPACDYGLHCRNSFGGLPQTTFQNA